RPGVRGAAGRGGLNRFWMYGVRWLDTALHTSKGLHKEFRRMDAPVAKVTVRINRWLPYLAVFQADVRQTLTSWIYRTWVFVSLIAALGYLLYRFAVYHGAKIIQPASLMISDLLRWTVIGSVTLVILLTAGTISSERGTLADSVLSRGISRHQYFLGKWHARLVTVLGTFLVM